MMHCVKANLPEVSLNRECWTLRFDVQYC